jgi:glycosyltransferase involved in cell wall biosynthesis
MEQLTGTFLYIAGSDLFNRLNQPSQHLPFHLANHLNHLDLVGYKRFYDGPRVPAVKRIIHGYKNVLIHPIEIENKGNIRILKVRRLRLPGSLDPMLQDLWLYPIFRPHLKKSYDVVVIDGPESAMIASFLKKSKRVRYLIYYDIDYYPGQSPQWSRILSRREQSLCKTADVVVSVSRPLSKLRQTQGAKATLVIPNGVEFDRFSEANLMRKVHPPTLVYVGSLDERWGVDLSIRSMPMLRQIIPGISLRIAGSGPAEQELIRLARSLGVENIVHFEGFIPYSDLPVLLAKGDIGIATSRENAFRMYASPLKIVEYMAAGLPVICSGGGEAEQMVNESGAGMIIPFTTDAFIAAVQLYFTTDGYLLNARQAAVGYARSRSWKNMGDLLADLYSQLLGSTKTTSLKPVNA